MSSPSLRRTGAGTNARAVVLLLHGGQEQSLEPVLRRHASWWRMALMQAMLGRFARDDQLALWLLKYRVRGWNATHAPSGAREPDPVQDARWALSRVREAHPGRPIVLVGHSMGGRTACRVADADAVVGVCALAPWLPDGEPVEPVAGRRLAVAHGTQDRWTSAASSRAYVRRATPRALSASWRAMDGVGHYMFRSTGEWHAFVRSSINQMLGPGCTGAERAGAES